MKNNIAIVMATYNGEEYLKEQVDSILNQTYSKFDLIIRDDNSIDKTNELLEEMEKQYKQIKVIRGKKNLGQVKNFNELMKYVLKKEYKYVLFADQDDFWMNNKVEETINTIKSIETRENKKLPVLVYSELELVDNNLKKLNIEQKIKTENLLAYNYIWGCTVGINRELLEVAYPLGEKCQNHDYWLALYAEEFGKIEKINKRLIKYRQHDNNVTGGINNYSLRKKLKNIKKTIKSYDRQMQQNIEFIQKNQLENKKKYSSYSQLFNSNMIYRIYILIYKLGISKNSVKETIIYYFYICFIFKGKRLKESV